MNDDAHRAADNLNRRFFLDFPLEAEKKIEELPASTFIDAILRQPFKIIVPTVRNLTPDTASRLLKLLPADMANDILQELPPPEAVRALGHFDDEERRARMARLDPSIRKDLETLLSSPRDTAGRVMVTTVRTFRRDVEVGEVLNRMRKSGMKTERSLFIIDDDQRLVGKVALQDAALAPPKTSLSELEKPLTAMVRPIDSLEQVADVFETVNVLDVPVINLDGVFLGAVTHEALAETIHKGATAGLKTMVGASREERALSNPLFAVRKHLP